MKKWTKILCGAFLVGALMIGGLAGCATVGNVRNTSSELVYNGNSAVRVEDYLYFGNALSTASGFSSEKDYSSATNLSYLARVGVNSLNSRNNYYSPKQVENVSKEVAGYEADFMFVLGQTLYYATPNRQMGGDSSGASHHFNYTCFYKSRLNGDSKKKLYTSQAEISKIEVLKFENKYYVVMLAGTNLVAINLSNDKVSTLAENVTSVALPKTYQENVKGSSLDWNGYIFYTTSREDTSANSSTNIVNRISVKGGEAESVYGQGNVTFIGREKDVLFFTEALGNLQTVVYVADLTNDNSQSGFSNKRREFVAVSSISDIHAITTTITQTDGTSLTSTLGYIYTQDSNIKYIKNNGAKGQITFENAGEALSSYKVLQVEERTLYLSTTTGIYRANIASAFNGNGGDVTVNVSVLAEMTDVSDSNRCAYDGDYLYFYAKLQTVPEELLTDEEKENSIEENADGNYYMYRVKVSGNEKFELLAKADGRITKK